MDKVHHMLNITSEAISPLSLAASNCGSVSKTVQSTYSVRSETSQPVFTLERPHSAQMVQPKRFVSTVQAREQGHDQEPRSAVSDLSHAKILLPAAVSGRCSWMCPPEESGFQLTPFNGPVRLYRKPREPTAPDYLEEHFWDQWSRQHQPQVGIGAYIHCIVILAGLLVHYKLESARRRGPRPVCVG